MLKLALRTYMKKTQYGRLFMFSLYDQHPRTLDKLADYSAIKQDEQDIITNDTAYNSKEKSIGFRMIFLARRRAISLTITKSK